MNLFEKEVKVPTVQELRDSWVLAHCGQRSFLGCMQKERSNAIHLDPAFTYASGIQPAGPGGQAVRVRMAEHLEFMPTLTRVELPVASTVLVDLGHASDADLRNFVECLEGAINRGRPTNLKGAPLIVMPKRQ